jgi:small-conductance mechanosensitive channel
MLNWLRINWADIVVPLLVFLAVYICALWLRRIAYRAFDQWSKQSKWEGSQIIIRSTRSPFLYWFLLLGAYIAIHISTLEPDWRLIAERIIASFFIISVGWTIDSLTGRLVRQYIGKPGRLKIPTNLLINVVRITIFIVVALIVLDVWGAPTTPIILLLFAVVILGAVAFKDIIANIASAFELVRGRQIDVGDFVRLESGEEGYVTAVGWRTTGIRALDGNLIVVPNSRLVQSTIINYGHPLKKATEPFRFYSRLNLKEITGLKASNLTELLNSLKKVPGSVIYYHTHNFLEEHNYLTPEPANDFALWVSDELGHNVLGEKLSFIDTFAFPTIASLRSRIIGVIEDYLSKNADNRTAPDGGEFHFIKSISFITPTPYIVRDLREFVEVLRKVSLDSIHFHMFEARLRLKKGINDFSIWIEDCLDDKDLADRLASLDPYNYTLEGLRSTIVQLIEKRIK